jgi:hypothetical protein
MKTPYAILIAGLLVAGAIAFHATRSTYSLTASGDWPIRLNNHTGEIDVCRPVPQRGELEGTRRLVCDASF